VTAAVSAGTTARQLSAEALAVMGSFPPRPVPATWKATAAARFTVMRRMLAPPFLAGNVDARHPRKLTMLKILDWLELHPGKTWQERWNSSGAGTDGTADWRDLAVAELEAAGKLGPRGGELHHVLGTGMVQLIGGDVLRPGLPWLLATTSPSRVAEEMGRTRDPAGIAALKKLREGGTIGRATFAPAVERVALIMAAKGGLVADITPGDCLTREEDNAFWAWAAVEVLRHTGIRLEELTELSHHSLVQYRLPSTGELVPLLSVAPSKTDAERLLVIL
jgi:hypothetical protein